MRTRPVPLDSQVVVLPELEDITSDVLANSNNTDISDDDDNSMKVIKCEWLSLSIHQAVQKMMARFFLH